MLRRPTRSCLRSVTLTLEHFEDRVVPANAISLLDPAASQFWGGTATGASAFANAPNEAQAISSDGQLVVFQSDAPNLVPNDLNYGTDVFLYDTGTKAVSLVSLGTSGTSATGTSSTPVISADGRYVAFVSNSNNLVAGVSGQQVYLYDVAARSISLVSQSTGNITGNSASFCPLFSGDGNHIVFLSRSTNLDSSVSDYTTSTLNLYIRDLTNGTTRMVSVDRFGNAGGVPTAAGVYEWYNYAVSRDGRFVAFQGGGDDFDPEDNNGGSDVFVRDTRSLSPGAELVSIDPNGFDLAGGSGVGPGAISDDGRFVVFVSSGSWAGGSNVYLRDRAVAITTLVSHAASGATTTTSGGSAIITPDGRFVAYVSSATGIVFGVTTSGFNLYRWSRASGGNELVSINAAGTAGGNAVSGTSQYFYDFGLGALVMTPDGRFIAFASEASNLVTGVTDANTADATPANRRDVFVRDMTLQTTTLVSRNSAGTATGNFGSFSPAISADGSVVAFESNASNLVAGLTDANAGSQTYTGQDIFVRRLTSRTTAVASPLAAEFPTRITAGGGILQIDSVTPDGRYILYASTATQLTPSVVTSSFNTNEYLLDTQTGTVEQVTRKSATVGGSSRLPARVSDDGRYVAFVTNDVNLDPNFTTTTGQFYLRDRQAGTVTLISRNTTSNAPANVGPGSEEIAISGDGRYVAFTSYATNLVTGVTTSGLNLYVYDQVTDTTRLVNINSSGTASGNGSHGTFYPIFSRDGSVLLFVTNSSDLDGDVTDSNNQNDVFAFDTATGVVTMLSVNLAGTGASSGGAGIYAGERPSVSDDGRYVVFGAYNSNNLTAISGGGVFRRDRTLDTTDFVSVDTAGTGPANRYADSAFISGDGLSVVFQTTASNVTAFGNSSFTTQVYLRDYSGTPTTRLVSTNAAGTAVGNSDSNVQINYGIGTRITTDGRYVAFLSVATDLVTGFASGGSHLDLYLWDATTGRTVLVDYSNTGTSASNAAPAGGSSGHSGNYYLTANGPTIVFDSKASDLINGDRRGDGFYRENYADSFAWTYQGDGKIAGILFNDEDASGAQNGGEPGIPFATVYIDANSNGIFEATEREVQTDANGNFQFTNLPAGTFTVRVATATGYITPESFVATLPTATSTVSGKFLAARSTTNDLVAGLVAGAGSTWAVGETKTLQLPVTNISGTSAPGPWQNAVYLSKTTNIGPDAILLGTATSPLAPIPSDGSANSSFTVTMPAVTPGDYYLIGVADRRGQANDPDRSNNVSVTASPVAVGVTGLTLGVPTNSSLSASNLVRYFQVDVPAGGTLFVNVNSASTDGATAVYVRRGALPTQFDFDGAGAYPGSPDQLAIVDRIATAGRYYILVRGEAGAAATSGFTITVTQPTGLAVAGTIPGLGGQNGTVTLLLRGSNFTSTTTVRLTNGTTTIPASSVMVVNPSTIQARFTLTGPLGTYDIEAIDGVDTSTLPGGYEIVAAVNLPVWTNLIVPGNIRAGRETTVYVEYENRGNVDIAAPVLSLSMAAGKGYARLSTDPGFVGETVSFLAASSTGDAGILHPGQRERVAFKIVSISPIAHDQIPVSLSNFASPATTIDWTTYRDALQPTGVDSATWAAVWNRFITPYGTTVGSFQARLADRATYLSRLGDRVLNVDELFLTDLNLATDASSKLLDLTSVDAGLQTSGPPLVFVRTWPGTITDRSKITTFGRGWTSNWDYSANLSGTDGSISITTPVGTKQFYLQADGVTYHGLAGDLSTVSFNTSGGVVWTQADGSVFEFLPTGELESVRDAFGNRISLTYTAGLLTTLTATSGGVVTGTLTIMYSGGKVSTVTDSDGRTTTYSYDGDGLLSNVSTPLGSVTYEYDTSSNLLMRFAITRVTVSDGTFTDLSYDILGRLSGTALNGGIAGTTYTYDTHGGITATDANGGSVTTLFNAHNQPEEIRTSAGNVTQYDYDAQGRLMAYTLPSGDRLSIVYSTNGTTSTTVDPDGNTVTVVRDPITGQPTRITDSRGNSTLYSYSTQGQLLSITYADGTSERFAYDVRGNPDFAVNRRGNTVDYSFDTSGRLTDKTVGGGTTTYTYDTRGNLGTSTDSTGTTTLTYESGTDRLLSIAYPDGRTVAYTYDAFGRRQTISDQNGYTVAYGYDAQGRLETLSDGSGTLVTYTYDPVGRVSRKDFGNGTASVFTYNSLSQLTQIQNLRPDTSVESQFDYTYDSNGRRRTETTAAGTTTYAYDANGQLVAVDLPGGRTIAYSYDAAGNRTSVTDSSLGTTTYTADDLNQYTVVGAANLAYDADGNLINDGTTTYTFDDENRLISVSGPGGTTTYHYDPFGNRDSETVNGVTTFFLYDNTGLGDLFGTYDDAGSLATIANYAHGLDLTSATTAGGTAFYQFDAIGSTVQITDSGGSVANAYMYLPFGETTVTAGGTDRFTFIGSQGVQTDGNGQHYMRARMYSSTFGGFYSNDPLGFAAGDANVRRYVNNSPVNLIDPSGLAADPCAFDFSMFSGPLANAGGFLTDFFTSYRFGVGQDYLQSALANGPGSIGSYYGSLDYSPNRYAGTAAKSLETAKFNLGVFKGVGLAFNVLSIGGQAYSTAEHITKGEYYGAVKDAGGVALGLLALTGNPVAYAAYAAYQIADPFLSDLAAKADADANIAHPIPDQTGGTGFTDNVVPCDPNDLTGPIGVLAPLFLITTDDPLFPYRVRFENDYNASAPAQDVIVTLQLDADLDWSTFEFDNFGFGGTVDISTAGLKAFKTSVDYHNPDGTPLRVDVQGWLDPTTGLVTVTFRSIDPATGEWPENALAGFLPPNDLGGHGEGFFNFTIRPKSGLATGTVIAMSASIVFDTNAPISTNVYSNTVDNTAPTATINTLPGTSTSANFLVTWSGSDGAGSGIATYDVFVSDNGGSFALWLDNTTAKSAKYPGINGHSYAFYVVATDNVGFVQTSSGTAQASTVVTVSTGGGGGGGSGGGGSGSNPALVGVPQYAVGGPGVVKSFNPDRSSFLDVNSLPGFVGGIRVALADVTGDGISDLIVGAGPGSAPTVIIFDGKTQAEIVQFQAFEASFTGGIYVTAGDLDRDGKAEVVVTPDQGGGPVVAIYRGASLASGSAVELVRFYGIQDDSFRGGARAGVGDVNGDGFPDVVVSAGFLGGPRIQIWDGQGLAGGASPTDSLANFFAFEDTLRNGCFVTVGDVNGDGFADLIFGGGPGGGPRVRIADGAALLAAGGFGTLDNPAVAGLTIGNFISGDGNSRGGVRVAIANLDGDNRADVLTGGGDGQPARVIAYAGISALGTTSPPSLLDEVIFGSMDGVYVG